MTNSFLVKIITPSQESLYEEVTLANLHGEEGVFGVMKGHSDLVANLTSGIITISQRDKTIKYYVDNGVANVTADKVEILSDFILNSSKNDKNSINQKIADFKNRLQNHQEGETKHALISSQIKKYQKSLNYIK
ncbi:MAG: hypothetical protein DGJ47_000955 [Rickettsiaceae bacterium]